MKTNKFYLFLIKKLDLAVAMLECSASPGPPVIPLAPRPLSQAERCLSIYRGDFMTTLVGVSLKASMAAAHRFVVDHLTLGGGPAGPGAHGAALLVDAGHVYGAVEGPDALGPAVGRATPIVRQASTGREVVHSPAL